MLSRSLGFKAILISAFAGLALLTTSVATAQIGGGNPGDGALGLTKGPRGPKTDPKIARNTRGDAVAVWRTSESNGSPLIAQRINAAGEVGEPIIVAISPPGAVADASVGIDGQGNFTVAYVKTDAATGATSIQGRRFTATGTARGAEFGIDSGLPGGRVSSPVVAMNAAGKFLVTWRNQSASVFVPGPGGGGGGPAAKSSGSTALSSSGSGRLVESFNTGIHGQMFTAAGTAQGLRLTVVNVLSLVVEVVPGLLQVVPDVREPSVAINESGASTIVWSTDDGLIKGQRYFASGLKNGLVPFLISPRAGDGFYVGPIGLPPGTPMQGNAGPQVAINRSGGFVVAWESGEERNGIAARRYDNWGAATGPIIDVSATAAGFVAATPSLATDDAGNFVVLWVNRLVGLNTGDIFVRRFAAGGSSLGPLRKLNENSIHTRDPAVATDTSSGSYDAVWRSVTLNSPVFYRRVVVSAP